MTIKYLVHSYLIDYEQIKLCPQRLGTLYILLMDGADTFLCKYETSKLVNSTSTLSITSFLTHVPIPFEDLVFVGNIQLDNALLNKIRVIETVSKLSSFDLSKYCCDFEYNDTLKIKFDTNTRHQKSQEFKEPLTNFVKFHVDSTSKDSIRSLLKTKYLRKITAKKDRFFQIPKLSQYSFMKYNRNNLLKVLIEDTTAFICPTNEPAYSIVLRKVSFTPRFSYALTFRNNIKAQNTLKDADSPSFYLIVSDGIRSLIASQYDEILHVFRTKKQLLKKVLELKRDGHKFETNSYLIRQYLAKKHIPIRKIFNDGLMLKRIRHLKKFVKLLEDKRFIKRDFLIKKGVTFLQRNRMKKQRSVYVFDFNSFYPSIISRVCNEIGLKRVFNLLIHCRKKMPKLKSVMTTLFGHSKRHSPTLFHRTLNEAVYIMYRTYLKNKSAVFGACKDSFFTHSDSIEMPFPSLSMKLENQFKTLVMKNINTYAGIEERTNVVVIKGLRKANFPAAMKIVNAIYKYISENQQLDTIEIKHIVTECVELSEADFHVQLKRDCTVEDYFHFGIEEVSNFVYCKPINNPLHVYDMETEEITPAIRPCNVVGNIDVERYVNEILLLIIEFSQTFGYLNIINENVICEADFFLKQFIFKNIFERIDICNLPGFQLHPSQLLL